MISTQDVYPCTIIADRYRGSYSGGAWLAFPLSPDDIPADTDGGDSECMDFWDRYQGLYGTGDTPEEAYNNLQKRIHKKESKTRLLKMTEIKPDLYRCDFCGYTSFFNNPHEIAGSKDLCSGNFTPHFSIETLESAINNLLDEENQNPFQTEYISSRIDVLEKLKQRLKGQP